MKMGKVEINCYYLLLNCFMKDGASEKMIGKYG